MIWDAQYNKSFQLYNSQRQTPVKIFEKNSPDVFSYLSLTVHTCTCCTIRSIATVFSAPRGTITSANFFVGIQNSSNAGLTVHYHIQTAYIYICIMFFLPIKKNCLKLVKVH